MVIFTNMSLCGQSPLFVPTTVNAQIRNIDAVDVAATSISCTNLTVDGEPISTFVQNIDNVTVGSTTFAGDLKANTLQGQWLELTEGATVRDLTASSFVEAETIRATLDITSSGTINASGIITTTADIFAEGLHSNTLVCQDQVLSTAITATDTLTATGSTTLGNMTCNSVETTGPILQVTDGSQAVLKALTADSITTPGDITQSAGTTSLNTLLANSITTPGNITQSAGTTSLKTTSISGTLSVSTVSYGTPYLTNLGGGIRQYGGVAVTPTVTQSSAGSAPVIYTYTYTFGFTSAQIPLLSSSYFYGKLTTHITTPNATTNLQAYNESLVNKLATATNPTITSLLNNQGAWNSFTFAVTGASTFNVVVVQNQANTPPAVLAPTLTFLIKAYDY